MLAAVVAACGGADDKQTGDAGRREQSKLSGSISVWIMDPGSPKIQGVVKQYGTDFEAAHPGTKVDIQFVPWAQAHDKFVTAIAGGKVPDVAEMGTTWTPEFADQGGLVEQPKISKGDYVSSLVDAATLNGKVYGKPWYAGARALIYRKDMLEKAGVEPPKTWDEMMAAAKAIKAKVAAGVYPVSLHRPERAHVPADDLAGRRADRHAGRRHLEVARSTRPRRRRRSTTTRPSTRTGLDPKAAVGWEEPDAQTAFVNGDVAMLIAGGWTYNSIIATKPELEKKIGTELDAGRPVGQGHRVRGRQPPGAVPGVQEQGPRRRVHRLHARARRS